MIVVNAARKLPLAAAGETSWLASSAVLPTGMPLSRTGAALALSGASYAAAVYASTAANTARFEPLPSGSVGLLIEAASTNQVLRSYNLTIDPPWLQSVGTASAMNQPGLTGGANTATVVTDSTAGFDFVRHAEMTVGTAALDFVASIFIKKDAITSRFPEFQIGTEADNLVHGIGFNTSTGASSVRFSVGAWTPTIVTRNLPGWWELTFAANKPSGQTQLRLTFLPALSTGTINNANAAGTGSITIAHVGIVTGTQVRTSPVQTTGTAIGYGAETTIKTVSPPAGGFAAAFKIRSAAGRTGNQFIACWHDTTANERVDLFLNSSGAVRLTVVDGGTTVADLTGAIVAVDTEVAISFSLAANSIGLCVDQTLVTRDTSATLPTLTRMCFGHNRTNAEHLNGHLIYGPSGDAWLAPVNDAGLQALNEEPTAPLQPTVDAGALATAGVAPLAAMTMTLQDEFDVLDIAADLVASGTKWSWFLPNGGYGGGGAGVPAGDLFSVASSILSIRAEWRTDHWVEGYVSSGMSDGGGFWQQFGFFEARMKMPPLEGSWPGFWLWAGAPPLTPNATPIQGGLGCKPELDIMEMNGGAPLYHWCTYHAWPDGALPQNSPLFGREQNSDNVVYDGGVDITAGYHTYGFLWRPGQVVWFFDGQPILVKTPPLGMERPMPVLFDLMIIPGAGEANHTTRTLLVDYVRVWTEAGIVRRNPWRADNNILPWGMSFTRAGAALRLGGADYATQIYMSTEADMPRIEHLPSGNRGVLLEGARTNTVTQSSNIIGGPWGVAVGSPTTAYNQAGLTAAANTASLAGDDSATEGEALYCLTTAPSAASDFCATVYVKKDAITTRFPELQIGLDGGALGFGAGLNTSTGVTTERFTNGAWTVSAATKSLPGWWAWIIRGTKPATYVQLNLIVHPAYATVINVTNVAAQGTIVIGHAEINVGTQAVLSPIQTTGATASYSAEITSMVVSPTAGGFALAFQARTATGKSGDQYLCSIDDNSANNIVAIRRNASGAIVLDVTSGGALVASVTGAVVADDTEFKVSASIAANSMNLCVNAAAGTRDTTCAMPTGLIRMRFGHDRSGVNHWNGHLIYGPNGEAWLAPVDDAGLQALNA